MLRSGSGNPIEDRYSQSGSGVLLAQREPERAPQAAGAGVGDVDGAATVGAAQPAEVEQAAREVAPERPREGYACSVQSMQ